MQDVYASGNDFQHVVRPNCFVCGGCTDAEVIFVQAHPHNCKSPTTIYYMAEPYKTLSTR